MQDLKPHNVLRLYNKLHRRELDGYKGESQMSLLSEIKRIQNQNSFCLKVYQVARNWSSYFKNGQQVSNPPP